MSRRKRLRSTTPAPAKNVNYYAAVDRELQIKVRTAIYVALSAQINTYMRQRIKQASKKADWKDNETTIRNGFWLGVNYFWGIQVDFEGVCLIGDKEDRDFFALYTRDYETLVPAADRERLKSLVDDANKVIQELLRTVSAMEQADNNVIAA